MANVSILNANGTNYDIADTTARTTAASAQTAAESAQTTATSAQTTAESAQTTAAEALEKANWSLSISYDNETLTFEITEGN